MPQYDRLEVTENTMSTTKDLVNQLKDLVIQVKKLIEVYMEPDIEPEKRAYGYRDVLEDYWATVDVETRKKHCEDLLKKIRREDELKNLKKTPSRKQRQSVYYTQSDTGISHAQLFKQQGRGNSVILGVKETTKIDMKSIEGQIKALLQEEVSEKDDTSLLKKALSQVSGKVDYTALMLVADTEKGQDCNRTHEGKIACAVMELLHNDKAHLDMLLTSLPEEGALINSIRRRLLLLTIYSVIECMNSIQNVCVRVLNQKQLETMSILLIGFENLPEVCEHLNTMAKFMQKISESIFSGEEAVWNKILYQIIPAIESSSEKFIELNKLISCVTSDEDEKVELSIEQFSLLESKEFSNSILSLTSQ